MSASDQVTVLVPKNVHARVVDPQGTIVSIQRIDAQFGHIRVSSVMVKAALTDKGHAYPVRVTVFDDAGYSLTMAGRAGEQVVVPYIHWAR